MKFPRSFYTKRISNVVENAHYRKKSAITKKTRLEFEYSIKLIGSIIDGMAESIDWPVFKLKTFDLEKGFTPEKVARHTRKLMNLKPDEPVRDINQLLEQNGIIVVELAADMKFDAVSIQTDSGYPVIILNKYFPNDRKRFNLAHELGHLLIHVLDNIAIPDGRDNTRQKESEANRFAGEFLMPEEAIRSSLYGLKISYLTELKRYWLVAMSSIIKRAHSLECIDNARYKYLMTELSRRGLRKNEGINVYIDQPKSFNRGYELHKNELEYTDKELARAFDMTVEEIKKFCDLSSNTGRLRVLV